MSGLFQDEFEANLHCVSQMLIQTKTVVNPIIEVAGKDWLLCWKIPTGWRFAAIALQGDEPCG